MARRDWAAATNGGTVTVQSTLNANYPAAGAIDGNRTMEFWGSGGGWASADAAPQVIEVVFTSMRLDEINVITSFGTIGSPAEPTLATLKDAFGNVAYTIEYYDGSYHTGATIAGNDKAWRQVLITPAVPSVTKVKVTITTGGGDTACRVVELEAWGDDAPVGRRSAFGAQKASRHHARVR